METFQFSDDEDENVNYDHFDDVDEEIEMNEEEMAIFESFQQPRKPLNLSQLIMDKIQENEQEGGDDGDEESMPATDLNPRVVEVYSKLGGLLSRYKSGKLPKAFKIIPSLKNWEEILQITKPEDWTPHATFAATRLFISNLKANMSQRFLESILLPKVRQDIQATKKLNYHYYMAIKKALYKPAAFFKGFLLPLCEAGDGTLKEAAIIGSVLVKVSVPMLHSAAALMKLSELEYSGPNSLFIRILLDKKYALPFRVVDSLVFHFLRFKTETRELPVLWHQALLVFCQRYKEDMTPEQKESLMLLVDVKHHRQIAPEIKRELANSKCRGDDDVPMM